MVNSMTAFAALKGGHETASWAWEMRSVNGRGLDVRVRLPEGCEVLEPLIKAAVAKYCARGTINVGLRLKQDAAGGITRLNPANLERVIEAALQAEDRAMERGLTLAPVDAADLLSQRGVLETGAADDGTGTPLPFMEQLKLELPKVVAAFAAARAAEGKALRAILQKQLDRIADSHGEAVVAAADRQEKTAQTLRVNIEKLLQNAEGLDEARLAQELAILAVKSDVTEELDRLSAHIDAARKLLQTDGPIGRKFDFLTQEFNREANTLCAKAGSTTLTRVGLDLKTIIDQMREQVQNVE
jgi:uncharacterized protein (TIGR00255 family)